MAYCPKCEVEYEESASECMDCHVPLRAGNPPAQAEKTSEPEASLVRVRAFSGPGGLMQAGLARNLLETEGIPCALQGQMMGEILPLEPIVMLVEETDAERAREILAAFLDNPDEQAPPAGP
jgi:hypothetical protein